VLLLHADGRSIVYASTVKGGRACPPVPSFDQGYVWPIYDTYDIYIANADGRTSGRSPRRQATTPRPPSARTAGSSYERARWRHGDLLDERRRQRRAPADAPRGSGWRAVLFGRREADRVPRPALSAGPELDDYRALLKKACGGHVPRDLRDDEDGSNLRQVTNLKAASFAPYFTPDGKKIIFSTNVGDPKGRNFDLYLVNVDGPASSA